MNAPVNYGTLRALVVDDSPDMRNSLRITLSNFGLTKVQMAANAAEAIYHVKLREFELVLCDFNLGDGRDGQQLLEELRHGNLISLDTAFMMVTAESVYEKVVATAELAPDDYLIKPFTPELMRSRLDAVLMKKRAFAEVYRHFRAHHLQAAAQACDILAEHAPKYRIDAMRFKGELLVSLGRFDEAEALYQAIIAQRAIPWARLGLARALHQQQQEAPAEAILQEVIEQAPEMVAAYDLLAEVCQAKKDTAAAQQALERGVAISGRTVHRQQRLGEVAHANGDLGTARTAFSNVLDKGRHSIFVSPSDFGNLCRVQVEQGDLAAAADTLKKHKSTLQDSPEGQLVMAVAQGMVHARSGNAKEADKALEAAAALRAAGVRGDARLMLDLADTCMASGRPEEADGIIAEVARNAHDSETLLAKARAIYDAAGRSDAGAALLNRATADVRKLNNEGVMLAQRGDFKSAVEKLLTACTEAPHNPRILMNAVWVILKYTDQAGLDEALIEIAVQHLDAAERQAPGHSRLAGLRLHLREVESRFGVKRKAAA
ncbi:MAG: response regulator [Gammaproteobacteria bacterium]